MKINLLTDHPSETDEFGGQSHDRIANAMVDTITQAPGGRAIGLEGTWGSGKSTVIELASKKLSERTTEDGEKFLVMTFDTWAHQDDPIRAVFLQELTERVISLDGVNRSDWEGYLQELKQKKKTTTEDIRDQLSWVTRLAILVIPFYPIAFALLRDQKNPLHIPLPYWFDSTSSTFVWAEVGLEWIVWPALFLPHIAAFIVWLSWRRTLSLFAIIRSPVSWFTQPKPKYEGKSVFRLYSKDTTHRVIDQTVFEAEATTNDFNTAFDKLVSEAAKRKRRLVIVLDNLDRLPNDTIKSTWATMRNFFAATPGTERGNAIKNVWLIVPFDRSHIENVFNENGDGDQAKGFIEKTFEIVLRVSPPILDDYRSYFIKLFTTVFGDTGSLDDCEAAFRLFDIHHLHAARQVTPRTIKNFMNSLASQMRQWRDTIPLQYQALYILLRDRLSTDPKAIKDPNLVDSRTKLFLGAERDWQKYLVAAHFNVHPDKAYQFLLAPDIKNHLIQNNLGELEKLQKSAGFEPVLNDLLLDEATTWVETGEGNLVIHSAATLAKLQFSDQAISNQIWRSLVQCANRLTNWAGEDARTREGFAALIEHSTIPAGTAKALVDLHTKSVPVKEVYGSDWFENLKLIQIALQSKDATAVPIVMKGIPLPSDADFIIEVAAEASTSGTLKLSSFTIPSGVDMTATFVANIAHTDGPTDKFLDAALPLSTINGLAHPRIAEAISKRLTENAPPLNSIQTGIAINMLRELIGVNKAGYQATINALAANGILHGILLKEKTPALQLSIISLMLTVARVTLRPDATNHAVYGDLNTAIDFTNNLLQAADKFDDFVEGISIDAQVRKYSSVILNNSLPVASEREFYRRVLRVSVQNKRINELHPSVVLQNYPRMVEILGTELSHQFLISFDGWISSVPDDIKGDEIQKVSSLFLEHSVHANTQVGILLLSTLNERFKEVTKEQWVAAFSNSNSWLRLLFICIKLNKTPTLGSAFSDALYEHFVSIAAGSDFQSDYQDDWKDLLNCLSSQVRATLLNNMRDHFVSKELSPDDIVFTLEIYGEITSDRRLSIAADKVTRLVIIPLIASNAPGSLETLEQYKQAFSECVSGAEKNTKAALSERLHESIAKEGEQSERLRKIATSLSIEIEEEVEEESAEDTTTIEDDPPPKNE